MSPPDPTSSNASRPQPRASTGVAWRDVVADTTMALIRLERRFDPFVRPAFDALLKGPLDRLTTSLINLHRRNLHLAIAEERRMVDEESVTDSIVRSFTQQMTDLWRPGGVERGGNTKTHGICRGEFTVHDNLPENLQRGIYAKPQTFKAWVRFAGPGPYAPPDIDDLGVLSIAVKLIGVEGPKLLEDEAHTLDLFGLSTPTFVTPDAKANAALQRWSVQNAQLFYFLNLRAPRVLDMLMQAIHSKTQTSPFETPYYSCVPYLMGEGQAMSYSFWPTTSARTPVPRLPLRPPDDYLRDAMVAALSHGDVELEVRLQLQTDPHLMPVENAGVVWPTALSPRVPVATLRLPRQTFDSPAQLEFAKRLSFNPWHTIAEHRPLGNQNRVRKRMYGELSELRHQWNAVPHEEPTGDEQFE
ncbi:hypothetical protein [Cellulomonas sp. URHD0024]|uniref:hypothetical protein n=1 Tax=Cellulomonas sp. URHD0024 TaxID=1302620 RepID=UPI000428EE3C|nr:hypothetical protein [Cellulomonas sp. URHD0024]